LDQIQLHAGLGLISSANSIRAAGQRDQIKYQSGFQLTLGIDLFSPSWVAETALRNFGQVRSGTEVRSLREFDLKLMNRNLISDVTGYRAGLGIGHRYLKIDDEANNLSINDNTPTALFFVGLETYLSKTLSIGLEAGLRSSMVIETADKASADLTLRLDTYF
jgi:hypothetical protein